MNKQMERWLAGTIFVGFTGTPLLRKDKQMTNLLQLTNLPVYAYRNPS